MTPSPPVPDPSPGLTFLRQATDYVRASRFLVAAFYVTLADYAGALLLAAQGSVPLGWSGLLILLSLFTWYFAVGMAVIGRAVRARSPSDRLRRWADVAERFGRVVVCAHALLFAGMLVVVVA